MITTLTIRNLGVIEDASLELAGSLTAVTGETGAGKTMVVSSLGLLLGQKADPGLVRHGTDRAVVEAVMSCDEQMARHVTEVGGDCEDGEVICNRQVLSSRRSRAVLGGARVTAGQLGSLTSQTITIHGQSEQIRLTDPAHQLLMLDRAGGEEMAAALHDHHELWSRYTDVAARLHEATTGRDEKDLQIEVLRRRLDEFDKVDPHPGEDDELLATSRHMQVAQTLRESLQQADQFLNGAQGEAELQPGALALVSQAAAQLAAMGDEDPRAAGLAQRAQGIEVDLTDLAADVARLAAESDTGPGELDEVMARLSAVQRLLRSRATTLDDLLKTTQQDRENLDHLIGGDDDVDELTAQVQQLKGQLAASASRLSAIRHRTAARLHHDLTPELAALAMPSARVEFQLDEAPMGPTGTDAVTIMLAANSGAAPASLSKAASGGELSRVRLALEVVLAGTESGRTLVFDEIDSGVGGSVGIEIGRRLAALATRHQVIVVTHLAQVAAFADTHLVVTKADDGRITRSGVREVGEADRERELARMMSGMSGSQTAVDHARELLDLARGGQPSRDSGL